MDQHTLASLGVLPPPGRKYTLHCVRAGAASAANALDISLPKIRRFGGWSLKSDVPLDYIDPTCPYSAEAQRFFGVDSPAFALSGGLSLFWQSLSQTFHPLSPPRALLGPRVEWPLDLDLK